MKIKYFQKGFNYSQDGKGNRLVYHLVGCNLRCPWCSNPEGMSGKTYEGFTYFEKETDEIVQEIFSCTMMFFDGGGVTFTGGEVTMQLPAVKELFQKLKQENIDLCIETNGMHANLPELFPYLDSLIMDFKSGDEEKLKEIAGGKVDRVFRNLQIAAETLDDILIRIPLVNGFNTSDADIQKIQECLSPYKENIKLELLRYHEFGKEKWKKCGLTYTMTEEAHVSDECFLKIQEQFKNSHFHLVRT